MDNSIQSPQPPQLNTKKGKIAQFFGELSKSRRIALIVVVLIAALGAGWLVFSKAETPPDCPSDTYFVDGVCKPPDCSVPANGSSPSEDSSPLCEEKCPENQVLLNGVCSTCPSETYIKDGKCVSAECSPSADGSICAPKCPENQVLLNGVCSTCPSETYIKDGKCVSAECSPSADGSICAPKCPTGQVLNNNVCSTTCPSDTYFVNGECKTPDCPVPTNGSSSNAGSAPLCEFKCPENQVLVGNKCITGNCPEDMFNNNGTCSYCTSEEDYIKNNKCISSKCFEFNNNASQSPSLCNSDDPQVFEYKPAGTYDDDVAFYTRGWETVQDDTENTYFKGSEHRANGKNNIWPLAFKFKGNNIKIYGSKGSTKGLANVTIDGTSETGIDYHDSTDKNQELVFDSGELEDGTHLLKLTGINYKGNITQEVRYISVDKIVVTGATVIDDRCPEGTTKQADGTCKLNDPSKDCPSGTTKQADGTCKDNPGKGSEPQKKVDTEISKKPEAKTVAEKLVNTGRFLLLPAIVAVLIILVAGGLYVVTKKKK